MKQYVNRLGAYALALAALGSSSALAAGRPPRSNGTCAADRHIHCVSGASKLRCYKGASPEVRRDCACRGGSLFNAGQNIALAMSPASNKACPAVQGEDHQ